MKGLAQILEALDPPVKHLAEWRTEGLFLTLLDPGVPAKVTRFISRKTLADADTLNVVVLYAVNELRLKGSHIPLEPGTLLIR
ncbi:hypothetical protein [Pseudomonas sp. EpS/L25]|uniref:hypothetical protein n=1 Tax=Pseudomonas sp. EpS/L25 TaxID=1749078 RepID=UPI000743A5B4|nr:hypothetical protein [Pseudomonas sp. EpS/L25]KUM43735.1 hypothetical protein AR540_18310 [Pseudomonas sp. EpS/L25]